MLEETSATITTTTTTATTTTTTTTTTSAASSSAIPDDEFESVSFDTQPLGQEVEKKKKKKEVESEKEEGEKLAPLKEESIDGLLVNVYEVTLNDPMKNGNMTTGYVTYSVNVRRISDDMSRSSRKRYNDFLFLQDALRRQHPSCVVPAMPEKIVGDKFSPTLIKERLEGLGNFLRKVVAHPLLVKDPILEVFLMGSEADFAERVAAGLPPAVQPSTLAETASSTSMFGSLINSVGQSLSNFGFNIGATKEEEIDPWFAKQTRRLDKLDDALSKLLLSSYNLSKEWRDLAVIESREAAGFLSLSRVLADEESSMKASAVSESLSKHTKLAYEMADIIEHNLHDCVKDYIKEIASIKYVLDKRQEYLRAYSTAFKNCQYKNGTRMSVAIRDVAKEDLECFSKEAREDIERTYKIRKVELLRAITSFVSVSGVCAGRYSRVWASSAALSNEMAQLALDDDDDDGKDEK